MCFKGQSLTSSSGAQAGSEREDSSWENDIWAFAKHLKAQRPPFFRAVARDAITYAFHRGEPDMVRTKSRRIIYALCLPFRASEYLGLALYRLRALLKAAHVPVLPSIINAICVLVWGIRIGDPVVMEEGVYIPHGQIVVDGMVFIGRGSVLCPWITIGLQQGNLRGPWLEEGVFVGTGAKILGVVRLGVGAHIGANAVVISDVPAWATAVGVPARTILNPNAPAPQSSANASSTDNEETPCVPS